MMIDHTVGKFFETLFWIGALLIFVSFFYPRWFMITIIVGALLMIIATVREGFRLRRAKTFIGVVKQNEPKILHRLILLIVVMIVFVYLFLKQTLVYNFMTQLLDLIRSPATTTWWVFVLLGIIIGVFILFCTIQIRRVKYEKLGRIGYEKLGLIWYKKIWKWLRRKREAKPEKKIKKTKIVEKRVVTEIRPGLFARMFWEEKSFWRRIFTPLLKRLEKRRIKKLEEKKIRIEELKKKKIEELKLKAKKEKILIKVELKKHPLLPRVLIALFIFAITTILILYKKGKFSIENPLSAATLGLIVGLFMLYVIVNIYKLRKEKKTKEEKQEKVVLAKIKKEVVAKASKYETDVDKLYRLIEEVGCLTITEVSEGFGITREQAEEWGKILESHDLIELNYPAIGELQLCKKKSKITE
ncbi:MAG: hypothetical protein Q8O03_02640 [Nanoarchaeota archaeon]|nr:hypothetical protein [Nanoarchaeota archaeon]